MTARTQHDAPASRSLPALEADHALGTPLTATPTSTLESDMHLIPEQMARNHLENRFAEADRCAHPAHRARRSPGGSGRAPRPTGT